MAVKAPPPAPAPVYTWTGFYVGGNIGYSWGNATNDFAFQQIGLGGPPFWTFNGTEHEHPNGVIGGAQAGYNWQAGVYLYGIEADIQDSGQKQTGTFSGVLFRDLFFGPNLFTASVTNQINWFGTVRGRLGVTSANWLFYATGGLAYGSVTSSGVLQPVPPFSGCGGTGCFESPVAWSGSATKVGWTAGAGVENRFFANWSWKIEYLYMDLGNFTTTGSGGIGNCYGAPGAPGCNPLPFPGTLAVRSHFTDNIVRVGLNYQFH
jgi:outer membrane immunogenic protein